MKILFTGSTHRQVSDECKKLVKRIDDSTIICNSLRRSGFNVDRIIVDHNTDLSQYELAIVGVGQLGSLVSRYVLNSFYTIAEHKNVILFFEDWRIKEAMSGIRAFLRKTDAELMKIVQKRVGDCDLYPFGRDPNFDVKKLRRGMEIVASGSLPCLVPGFKWGDKSIISNILGSQNIHSIDLTPHVLENWNIPLEVEQKPKQKAHMLASLADHSKWVEKNTGEWRTDYYGGKNTRLSSETEVFYKCGDYWSILCPKYPHAGCGWFRARWVYGAIWKSIVLCSEQDSNALGLRHINPEKCSDTELRDAAEAQSAAILSNLTTAEEFDESLIEIVMSIAPNLTRDTSKKYYSGLGDFM